jgi:nanoRNase/pAp phosphatase (c-di-AMP/oligoRNAs hydrolase)
VLDREKGREGVFVFVNVVAVGDGGSGGHGPAAAAEGRRGVVGEELVLVS